MLHFLCVSLFLVPKERTEVREVWGPFEVTPRRWQKWVWSTSLSAATFSGPSCPEVHSVDPTGLELQGLGLKVCTTAPGSVAAFWLFVVGWKNTRRRWLHGGTCRALVISPTVVILLRILAFTPLDLILLFPLKIHFCFYLCMNSCVCVCICHMYLWSLKEGVQSLEIGVTTSGSEPPDTGAGNWTWNL